MKVVRTRLNVLGANTVQSTLCSVHFRILMRFGSFMPLYWLERKVKLPKIALGLIKQCIHYENANKTTFKLRLCINIHMHGYYIH